VDARVKLFGLEYAYWSLLLFALLGLLVTFIIKSFRASPRQKA
jgi:hypothetical protein